MVRTAEKGVRTVEGKFDRTEKLTVGAMHGIISHMYISQHFTKSKHTHTTHTQPREKRERERGRKEKRRRGKLYLKPLEDRSSHIEAISS